VPCLLSTLEVDIEYDEANANVGLAPWRSGTRALLTLCTTL